MVEANSCYKTNQEILVCTSRCCSCPGTLLQITCLPAVQQFRCSIAEQLKFLFLESLL